MSTKRAVGEKTTHRFSGPLIKVGSEYCIDIPPRITRALGGSGRIAVAVRVANGHAFNATLRPRRGHPHRLFLNDEARDGKKLGNVALTISAIAADRAVPMPRDLAAALREADVTDTWSALPPGKREHIIRYIEQSVHEGTRLKRIAQAVEVTERRREQLLAKQKRG